MNRKLLNTYIKSVKKEDGPAIVNFYKEQGFNTSGIGGNNCQNDGNSYIYYGVDNKGYFDIRCLRKITNQETQILTLEEANMLVSEKQFPRVMLVSHDDNITTAKKRVVFIKKKNKYIAWNNAETLEEAENVTDATAWKYAWEVEELKSSRFPFKLSPVDANEIIKMACPIWQERLANKWAIDVILGKEIIIEDTFYKEMRKACTSEQHLAFDKIFGKD